MNIGMVLAIIAIVVSAGSALFTFLQATAARDQAEAMQDQLTVIRDQWHDMQRPRVRAWYHLADSHEAITFVNDGPVDIDDGTIEVGCMGHQLIEKIGGCQRIEHFAWPVGSGESYVITRMRPDPGKATFRLTCAGPGGRRWDVAISCDIPGRR